ncbi:tRNA dihydrouridine(20/20a) synthase DusA [Aquicella lusitana]|uniref:tRNA-dihydrouridine(20/20a) synthase n=2 Tax=Aquicella lusitana TaxID=254246 RepID=A0A370GRQ0_9COXI|nr:tRNA dihydrouridine(20/20a) synthase DusA [Aquicella lusitana]RDI46000.1 tRNA-U16,U17-dihydrouridine synthase [Aquicella lusitana]VVC73403.1 tRNA-dihydrouridine synthase A [Aquicella lusitana]
MNLLSHLVSVAPMMDYTDRHDRYFLRLIAPNVRLYTEMITTQALIHGDPRYLLAFHPDEHPLALQLGGSDPALLARCAVMGEEAGYDEVNLNVGCPSPRVSSGQFGACLMQAPQLVAECISAMQHAVQIPVSVKCRIGVDYQDSYEALCHFIRTIASAGCRLFIVHARKAWLSGLSPKQNREIPPLRYDVVRQLKQDFPQLTIIMNGGIKTVAEIDDHLSHVDGVMIGRAAYANPYLLAEIQARYYPDKQVLSRFEVIQNLIPYIHEQLQNKIKLTAITRHILGLFQGQRGAAAWRRYLSQHAHKTNAGVEVLQQALAFVKGST